MRISPCCRGGALLCFWLSLALVVSFCYGDGDKTVEVVGSGDCADCAQHSFDTKLAYSGLRVTVDCKTPGGHFKTRGSGELDEEGKFKVSLPNEMLNKEGKLNEDCYAQLHSSSDGPCPTPDGLESSKILSQTIKATADDSTDHDKHTFGLAKGKLKFSPVTCASAFFWNHFHKKHPLCPPKTSDKPPQKPPQPPAPKKEPCPPPVPKKKPDPPKEKDPKKEPCPPKANKPPKKEVPKKKPCPPKPEIKPPPTPVPVPVYKPKHPFFKHPFFKHPFFKHHPLFPKIPYHPLFPRIPPFFDHPIFGKTPSSSTQNP